MLRLALAAVGAALVLAGPAHAQATCDVPRLDATTAEARTAAALGAALDARAIGGRAWLGKLPSVGGGRRDTIVWAGAIDPARPVDVVVYLEGHGSFADAAMDHRHAAAIATLGGNAAYVAPDAPSSSHGEPTAGGAYWQAGCAARRCPGGHAAPGDFVALVRDARARIAALACVAPDALALRLHLIGFSNGGQGVTQALGQLAAVDFTVDDRALALGDVVFADGNYGTRWLADAWRVIAARPAARLTILVRTGGGDGNRRRAAAFWRAVVPGARLAPGRAAATERLRLVPLARSHHEVGDVAIDHVRAE